MRGTLRGFVREAAEDGHRGIIKTTINPTCDQQRPLHWNTPRWGDQSHDLKDYQHSSSKWTRTLIVTFHSLSSPVFRVGGEFTVLESYQPGSSLWLKHKFCSTTKQRKNKASCQHLDNIRSGCQLLSYTQIFGLFTATEQLISNGDRILSEDQNKPKRQFSHRCNISKQHVLLVCFCLVCHSKLDSLRNVWL